MRLRTSFTTEEAWILGWVLGVDWDSSPFDVERFRATLDTELEFDLIEADELDIVHLDPLRTARRALAHLTPPDEGVQPNEAAHRVSAGSGRHMGGAR